MGRLFWKFFFFFWLAQFVTSIGVGAAIWLLHPAHGTAALPHMPPLAERGPPLEPGAARPELPPAATPANAPPPAPRRPRSLLPPVMPIIAGSFVSVLFAALLAWYFARPIRTLRGAFNAVAGGRLDKRVGAELSDRRDELADLGKDFDQMADRLQSLLDAQRRLLHDVSHELRSPLARLQAAADLLRQQPQRSAEFIERIERDTARMDRLVGELLTLARLDGGVGSMTVEEVAVPALLGAIVADARVEAESKACEVRLAAPEEAAAAALHMRGNAELIRRALENVVRNAVRHSPPGGKIDVAWQALGQRLRVTVADQGPGVAEADLAAIFAPFFRSGTADAFSGHGLGLAIARRVVEMHGGSIAAANRAEGGLRVTLDFSSL